MIEKTETIPSLYYEQSKANNTHEERYAAPSVSSKAEKTKTKKSLSIKSLAISDFAKQFERKARIDALKAAQAQGLVERELDGDKEIMENQIRPLRFETKMRASRTREQAILAANIKAKSVAWNRNF